MSLKTYQLGNKSRGLGLVGAIFVIVVVSLLSLAMAKMIETDQTNYSYEILSLKAFMAAESGAQLAVNRLFAPSGTGSCVARSFSFTDAALLHCSAAVACAPLTVGTANYYTLTSESQCQAGTFVTRRTVEVRVRDN